MVHHELRLSSVARDPVAESELLPLAVFDAVVFDAAFFDAAVFDAAFFDVAVFEAASTRGRV
jgi:hypothetical protein